jgi:hypothetical protein
MIQARVLLVSDEDSLTNDTSAEDIKPNSNLVAAWPEADDMASFARDFSGSSDINNRSRSSGSSGSDSGSDIGSGSSSGIGRRSDSGGGKVFVWDDLYRHGAAKIAESKSPQCLTVDEGSVSVPLFQLEYLTATDSITGVSGWAGGGGESEQMLGGGRER